MDALSSLMDSIISHTIPASFKEHPSASYHPVQNHIICSEPDIATRWITFLALQNCGEGMMEKFCFSILVIASIYQFIWRSHIWLLQKSVFLLLLKMLLFICNQNDKLHVILMILLLQCENCKLLLHIYHSCRDIMQELHCVAGVIFSLFMQL